MSKTPSFVSSLLPVNTPQVLLERLTHDEAREEPVDSAKAVQGNALADVEALLAAAEQVRRRLLVAHRSDRSEESARRLNEIERKIESLEQALQLIETAGQRNRGA